MEDTLRGIRYSRFFSVLKHSVVVFVFALYIYPRDIAGAYAAENPKETKWELCNGHWYCNWRIEDKLWGSNLERNGSTCSKILSEDGRIKKEIVDFVNSGNAPDISYDRNKKDPSFQTFLRAVPIQEDGASAPLDFPMMLEDSFSMYCEHVDHFRKEFSPRKPCNHSSPTAVSKNETVISMPWCGKWNASAIIGMVNCGIAESVQSHRVTMWSLYSSHGILSAKDRDNHRSDVKVLRTRLDTTAPVEIVEKAGIIGYIETPIAHGHFMNEILPRLIFLDKYLPLDIPVYWPALEREMPHRIQSILQEHNVLSGRKFIPIKHDSPSNIVAKELYFVTTDTRQGEPLCLWSLLRNLQSVFTKILQPDQASLSGSDSHRNKIFVVNRRANHRTIENFHKLMEALKRDFPTGSDGEEIVESIEFGRGMDMIEAGRRIRRARVFVASHGAGMNNMFMLSAGTTVVEIGYIDDWPSDYCCLARNLGHRYYATLSIERFGDKIVANIDEIRKIVRKEYNHLV